MLFALIFCQSLNRLQRGLTAIAELLVNSIRICHPLLLVSCNDRMGTGYATTPTQALLQVLASYSMQCISHSHVLIPIPCTSFPFPSHVRSYSYSDGGPMGPMGSQYSPFLYTALDGSPPSGVQSQLF